MYQLTHAIWQGPFASPERMEWLADEGVTHILNVSDGKSLPGSDRYGFREVHWVPLADYAEIPHDLAIEVLEALHAMVTEPDATVYVHCTAGWNRSPTVVWLYLVACGHDPKTAADEIEERNRDGIAGHPSLVGDDLVEAVTHWGSEHCVPHPRPAAIEFAAARYS